MEIKFYNKNLELSAALKAKIAAKIEYQLSKYQKTLDFMVVQVDISRDTHHNKGDILRVEINADVPKHRLRAVEEADDVLAAVDMALHKLERQARDVKEQIISKRRQG